MPPKLPPKKEVMLALLETTSVFMHLDPRRPQVAVPAWFTKQPQLVLQVGLNMAVPIRDLSVDDECVSCTLSFNRSPFFCWIPWSAIYALVGEDGRGMVWPDDVPPEVAAQAQGAPKGPGGKAAPAASRRPHLRAVGDDAPAGEPSSPAVATAETSALPVVPASAPASEPSPEATPASETPPSRGAPASSDGAGGREADAEAGERRARPSWLRVVK